MQSYHYKYPLASFSVDVHLIRVSIDLHRLSILHIFLHQMKVKQKKKYEVHMQTE